MIASQCLLVVMIAVLAFAGVSRNTSVTQRSMANMLAKAREHAPVALGSEDEQSSEHGSSEDINDEEGQDDEDPRDGAKVSGLIDGEYTGTGQGYGGQITMRLVVENGSVASLDIVSAPGETPAYLSRAKTIIPKIISSGSADIDGVSGATYSSNGIKAAAAQALKQAGGDGSVSLKKAAPKQKRKSGKGAKKRGYKKPVGGWKDSTYTGSARGFGGRVSVRVTIKKGKIRRISASGKRETSSYWRRAQAVKGRIIKKQSPRVDAVSGATYSSRGIINAVITALNKAGRSGPKDQVITTGENDYVLDEGEKASLKAKAKTKLSYKTSNRKIVKVSKKGVITAVKEGEATITIIAAKTKRYKRAAKKVKVTVSAKGKDDPDKPDEPDDPDDPDKPDEPDDPDKKINGTFTGSARGYGGQVTATVVIKDSIIESITVEGKKETQKYWVKAKRIVASMIAQQTWDVDAVSGATYSSDGIRYAVKQALESAGLI